MMDIIQVAIEGEPVCEDVNNGKLRKHADTTANDTTKQRKKKLTSSSANLHKLLYCNNSWDGISGDQNGDFIKS